MNLNTLPVKNLKRKEGRSAALIAVVILLSISMLGGSLILSALESGLSSLETRLGADIIVVPDEAKSKKNLESILLDGVPGYFYMDKAYFDKVAAREGIGDITAQYYLASAKAGCCSMPVQIIGFDPESDFTVTPWIKRSGGGTLGLDEVVAGCNINKDIGGKVKFFGVSCTIKAKLDQTGTALDNAVYANYDTVRHLIEGSKSNSFKYFSDHNPDEIISSILINVQEGYDVSSVAADINIHVRGVEAVATKSMLSGVSDSLAGVSRIIRLLVGLVWILMIVILFVVFSFMINERKKEFAILRTIGMSEKMLSGVILKESVLISVIGSLIGIAFSLITIYPFSTIIENEIGLPFLMPGFAKMAGLAAATLILSVLATGIASARAAVKLSHVDTGLILREGN